ncbi:MAG: NAD-dependent epimerase/dehydratase family protein [Chitinophagaceae bacterium]|nr:NAD-dependent epimerase/dehydratase family protein [Chitinophagaceae bacterium]
MSIPSYDINSQGIHPPATVLVTGGSGFVGAYVTRDLVSAGYRVKALRRKRVVPFYIHPDVLKEVEWIDCDILDTFALWEAMRNTDAVIHTAAKVSFHAKDRHELFSTNVEGTANVVNAALENNVRRFIHVSSVASLGKRTNGTVVNEDSKWQENKLNTNYAVSKYYGEMEVWRGIAEGLNAVIVNPSTILGYGDWNSSSNALFKNAYNGFPWYTNGVNGFVDIEDVSKAIVKLLATNIRSERFILNGDNWSYRKLLDTIADSFGKRRPYRNATPLLSSVAWRLEKFKSFFTGKKVLLTREAAKVAQSNTNFDNNKILNALPGFSFTNLEQTIKKACVQYSK